ncbi:carboxylesterase family protein [Streptomyces sp. NPDC051776]|uniref:carboxylesterase family protein n=1 Tax=Streptomyces sp. NPDC051776 TaxID=3155414 RepID=UPI00342F20EF
MVWIYGGQWAYGASSMPHYDGPVLAGSGVVVVTFNYRAGRLVRRNPVCCCVLRPRRIR